MRYLGVQLRLLLYYFMAIAMFINPHFSWDMGPPVPWMNHDEPSGYSGSCETGHLLGPPFLWALSLGHSVCDEGLKPSIAIWTAQHCGLVSKCIPGYHILVSTLQSCSEPWDFGFQKWRRPFPFGCLNVPQYDPPSRNCEVLWGSKHPWASRDISTG